MFLSYRDLMLTSCMQTCGSCSGSLGFAGKADSQDLFDLGSIARVSL